MVAAVVEVGATLTGGVSEPSPLVRSNTLVLPAARVTPPLAETQLVPSKYSSATLEGVFWVSVLMVALAMLGGLYFFRRTETTIVDVM